MAAPDHALAAALARVRESPDHLVLERMVPVAAYAEPDGRALKRALYVDTETTGIARDDAIIELAIVPFEFDPQTGEIFTVGPEHAWLEDPGRPIPEEVARITHITDDMVRGQRIPDGEVLGVLQGAVLVIAHNAAFDRPMCEARFPAFRDLPWGCSQREVNWRGAGYDGVGLDYLMMKHARAFHAGHRAAEDCHAGIRLLATPFADGARPLQQLLVSARTATVRLRAVGAPIEVKDLLKQRGYRWNNGDDGRPKAWWIDVPETAVADEKTWLAANAYSRGGRPQEQKLTARTRYSLRADGE